MDETVKKDILAVLDKGRELVSKNDSFGLHELSNRTIHNASIFQDEGSIIVAVVMYALSKMIQRGKVDIKTMERMLKSAADCLRRNEDQCYIGAMQAIANKIRGADTKMGLYMRTVIDEARVKKGFKLLDHGISLAQAAKVLGVSQWDLMDYVGMTNVYDETYKRVDVKQRIQLARRLFS
ncbi:hypothetical protein JXB11_00520 [Candidatus Woesearchaeota archaeon]|nr:hypothetical protein [Candidatus Woesearchaeota archaeon]